MSAATWDAQMRQWGSVPWNLNRPSSASNQSGGPVLVLSLKLPSSTLGERGVPSSCRRAQGYIFRSNSSSRNQDPAPRLRYCFPAAPPFFLHPLPSLISTRLNLPFGMQFFGAQPSLWSNPHKRWASLIAQLIRNLPAMQEAQVWLPEKG